MFCYSQCLIRFWNLYLEGQGHDISSFSEFSTVDQMLEQSTCCYLTDGLASLKTIPDASVDFIWSQAVLEHVRKDIFFETISELRRVLKDDGVCSHQVDLKDHLGGSLNNLRFNEGIWESNFFSSSGFYTNRIRFYKMLDIFKECGFNSNVIKTKHWKNLPIKKTMLSKEFSSLSKKDFIVQGFHVVLKKI